MGLVSCDGTLLDPPNVLGKVALWSQQSVLEGGEECGEGWKEAADVLELEDSVTAVDFAPVTHQGR